MDKDKLEWHTKSGNPYRRLQRELVLDLCRGKKVLDIGGGTGRTANDLAKRGYSVTVVDCDKELIEYGQKHFKGIRFVYGDARRLNLEEAYDEVLLEHMIEHIKEQKQVIDEAKKVLKKGGRLIVSTPNKWVYRAFICFGKAAYFRFNEMFCHVPGHIAELNVKGLRTLLKDFEDVRIIGINPFAKKIAENYPQVGIGLIAIGKK